MNGRDARDTYSQGSTSEAKSTGLSLAMSKLPFPFKNFQERIQKAVMLNDGAILTLRVRVGRCKDQAEGEITEIRAISDENGLR